MSLDTLYTAETPEGIALALRPAGLVSRFLAYVVDFGIRIGIYLAVGMVSSALGGMGTGLLFVMYFVLEWFYPVLFELSMSGATPGKRMLGLEVVMDSGLPLTPAASIIRNLLRAADFMPLMYAFGAASMLWRHDFKRLGDIAAGTLVVYRDTVGLHGKLPDAPAIAPARALAPREQAAIVAWAGRAARLTPARLDELAVLAQSVTQPERPSERPSATQPASASASASQPADPTAQLLGVAQWLIGKRDRSAP